MKSGKDLWQKTKQEKYSFSVGYQNRRKESAVEGTPSEKKMKKYLWQKTSENVL